MSPGTTSRGWSGRAGAMAGAALNTLQSMARGQAALRHAGHRRLGWALWSGARATLVSLGRAVAILWLQTTGLFFVVFSVVGGMAAVHEYRLWLAHRAPAGKFILATIFSAVFGWFAVSSFWRAGRRSRSHGVPQNR